MAHYIPQGFRFASLYSGIKQDTSRPDMTLIVSDVDAVGAGVYTQNLVCAAPVVLDRSRTPGSHFRSIFAISGNANACTGERGYRDAVRMAELAGEVLGTPAESTLVLSTGIIGHFLPMETIEKGCREIVHHLASDETALDGVARGLMTTDTVPKCFTKKVLIDGVEITLAGLAKGSGMIAPNMATFLGVVLTDAKLNPTAAQKLLQNVADKTLNCVTVEGHTSTNDTLLMLGNGLSGSVDVTENPAFVAAVEEICEAMARSIASDGEGASHLVTIHVHGTKTEADARKIAREIAESALVKCAFTGNDPNWGRIVSAAGYAGVAFDVAQVSLDVNGFRLFEKGSPVAFNAAEVSRSMRENREITVDLRLGEGTEEIRFWTCDLTTEYVHINADYHT